MDRDEPWALGAVNGVGGAGDAWRGEVRGVGEWDGEREQEWGWEGDGGVPGQAAREGLRFRGRGEERDGVAFGVNEPG